MSTTIHYFLYSWFRCLAPLISLPQPSFLASSIASKLSCCSRWVGGFQHHSNSRPYTLLTAHIFNFDLIRYIVGCSQRVSPIRSRKPHSSSALVQVTSLTRYCAVYVLQVHIFAVTVFAFLAFDVVGFGFGFDCHCFPCVDPFPLESGSTDVHREAFRLGGPRDVFWHLGLLRNKTRTSYRARSFARHSCLLISI